MFTFTAIDFETALRYYPCSIGIALVENNQLVEVTNRLIKPVCYPYFERYAQSIHHIHKEDVENEPLFKSIYNDILPKLQNKIIVAHNAAFDINVLRFIMRYYNFNPEELNAHYLCTYLLSRKVWPDNGKFSLDYLSNQHNIQLNHHHSDSDAQACALLLLKEAETLGCTDFEQIKYSTGIRLQRV